MQRLSLFMFLLLVTGYSHALQVPSPTQQLQPPQAGSEAEAPPQRQSPPAAEASAPSAVPAAPAARPAQPAAPGKPFRPTEKIRADSAVSFPVDI